MGEKCEVCGAPATRGLLCIACDEDWEAEGEVDPWVQDELDP